MEKLMNASKAASILGIQSPTLRKWIRDGTFPGKIITEGREVAKFLIAESDVTNFTGIKNDPENPHSIFNNEQEFVRLGKRFDDTDNQIISLKTAIFKQINGDKRNNQESKIDTLNNNQSKIYNKLNQVLEQFEELSNRINELTSTKQASPPPNTPSPVKENPLNRYASEYDKFGGR